MTLNAKMMAAIAYRHIETLADLFQVFIKLTCKIRKSFDVAGLKNNILANCAVVQTVYVSCKIFNQHYKRGARV
jgi:hypothetical protein